MLSLDMLYDIVQTTLRFQTESAFDGGITVKIMLVDKLFLVFLGTQRLCRFIFVQSLKLLSHLRIIIRRFKIRPTLIFASTALLTKS